MKIYVVTKGSYSDYHVVAATLDEERAKKIAEKYSDNWDECEIEVFEDSDENIKTIYEIYFKGSTEVVDKVELAQNAHALRWINNIQKDFLSNLYVYVFADTPEEAVKIAAEKRAEYLAREEGLA